MSNICDVAYVVFFVVLHFWPYHVLDKAKLILYADDCLFSLYLVISAVEVRGIRRITVLFLILVVPAQLILIRKQSLVQFTEIQVSGNVFKHCLEVFEFPFELLNIRVHGF